MATLKENLTNILIDNSLITRENLEKAISTQKQQGGSLSQILIDSGNVKEKDLVIALSQGLGIPPINLNKIKVDKKVVKLISKDVAQRYLILPISQVGTTLTVAMADPLNVFTLDDLKVLTNMKINPVITTANDIKDAIKIYYEQSQQVDGVKIDDIIKNISSPDIELVNDSGKTEENISFMHMIDEAPIVKITNRFLTDAVKLSASDILFEPFEKTTRVRCRVDGALREIETLPKYMHEAIVSRTKVISGLDISEHRLPQDGRFKIKFQSREVDFRISILPSVFGEKVALRVLDKTTAMLDVEKLNFSDHNLNTIKHCSSFPHGMMLVCGPTGSGKTTTLYSILKYVDSPEKNIVTVEDPVEYQLNGVNQVTCRIDIGLTFAAALRSILRQDPDIIMVGEIRDFETLDISIKSALTGHMVLSTLHTTTASGSIIRMLNMGAEPFLITSCVVGIIAQRLVRKLCPKCKESYKPSKAVLDTLSIKDDINENVNFCRPKGCPECFNVGYRGRIAICEVLVLTHEVKGLILKRAQEHQIKKMARSQGMRTLREDGIDKIITGLTTPEEVLKVTASDAKA
ncbi:MAG: ATPase, T2SS/T4P/T4SS family [Candidatus Gygaella obscura]|nr:ATPase, T2SS/T4P/T4SS family [Candidatus Gygaella obscura]